MVFTGWWGYLKVLESMSVIKNINDVMLFKVVSGLDGFYVYFFFFRKSRYL